MGRVADDHEFLPRRLPSDFTFDEPVDHSTATGAAIGDYSAFFGSSSVPNMFSTSILPSTGTRRMWNANDDVGGAQDDTAAFAQQPTSETGTFSVFGGGTW